MVVYNARMSSTTIRCLNKNNRTRSQISFAASNVKVSSCRLEINPHRTMVKTRRSQEKPAAESNKKARYDSDEEPPEEAGVLCWKMDPIKSLSDWTIENVSKPPTGSSDSSSKTIKISSRWDLVTASTLPICCSRVAKASLTRAASNWKRSLPKLFLCYWMSCTIKTVSWLSIRTMQQLCTT